MISKLIKRLSAAGVDLTSTEIAEALWLAARNISPAKPTPLVPSRIRLAEQSVSVGSMYTGSPVEPVETAPAAPGPAPGQSQNISPLLKSEPAVRRNPIPAISSLHVLSEER